MASKARALASFTLLLWAVLLSAASRTPLSGFPQRFGRDLGVPLAVLAAFALVTIPVLVATMVASYSRFRDVPLRFRAHVVAGSRNGHGG